VTAVEFDFQQRQGDASGLVRLARLMSLIVGDSGLVVPPKDSRALARCYSRTDGESIATREVRGARAHATRNCTRRW
jgi:hypothetical protein